MDLVELALGIFTVLVASGTIIFFLMMAGGMLKVYIRYRMWLISRNQKESEDEVAIEQKPRKSSVPLRKEMKQVNE